MTLPDEPSDAELLAATARGDEAAFDRFVARHRAAVFRYARNHGGDTDAEDVLQQTFVAAWRGAATADAVGGARPWLFTIARHALLRLRRRSTHAPERETSLDELGTAAGFAASDATPERFAAATEERELLQSALAALPAPEREILHLRDLEQLPGEKVAALLELTLPAMKSRLHRARLHLVAEVRRRIPEEDRP